MVCEVDALEGKVSQGTGLPGLYPADVDHAFHNMVENLGHMPLPDEDDADL
jgi:hypothetical protein